MNVVNKFKNHSRGLTWSMALLLTAMVTACGGGGGDGGRDPILGAPGALAPTVIAVTPARDATNVPTNTRLITATFNKAMDPATLTTGSFTLACPAGSPQIGAVTYAATDNKATLTLASNLPILDAYAPARASVMFDYSPSEFSRLRLQLARDKSRPGVVDNQIFLQYIMSLGTHAAHAF